MGSRRFGISVITKDNLTFGIKESSASVAEKVACEDSILNNETKKCVDRRAEFWLEFENGVRMHAEMLDSCEPNSALIPP